MEKTVLIVADDPDYGGFLESLVSLTGLQTRLVTFGMLPRGLLEDGRFEMFVLESLNPVTEDLCRYAVTQRLPVAVVGENSRTPSNFSKNNCKFLWFFSKPLEPAKLLQCMREVIGQSGGDPEEGALWEPPYLIGVSASMRAVRHMVGRVSRSDIGVIIRGETGTGKGVVAMAIHNNSHRRHAPFIEVNCSAIPAALLESELFGYRKGAFTGAYHNKPGKFDLAQGGSLFLDEISEMSPAMQAKVLHVLQDGEYAPLGSVESVRCSVRIFSASNAPLEDMMVRGQFRRDLYHRLKVIQIVLPPLRERREDVGPLREHFINKFAALFGRRPLKLSRELCQLMRLYHWPGNVRELENYIKGVVALGSEEEARHDLAQKVKETKHVPVDSDGDPNARSLVEEIRRSSFKDVVQRVSDAVEHQAIVEALENTQWNRRKAAALLGVSSRTLYNKMRELRITPFAK